MGLRNAKPFGLFEKGIELYIDAFEIAKFLEERDHLTKCHEFRAGIISHFLYIEREENDFSAYIFYNAGSLGDKSYIHYKALALPNCTGESSCIKCFTKIAGVMFGIEDYYHKVPEKANELTGKNEKVKVRTSKMGALHLYVEQVS